MSQTSYFSLQCSHGHDHSCPLKSSTHSRTKINSKLLVVCVCVTKMRLRSKMQHDSDLPSSKLYSTRMLVQFSIRLRLFRMGKIKSWWRRALLSQLGSHVFVNFCLQYSRCSHNRQSVRKPWLFQWLPSCVQLTVGSKNTTSSHLGMKC